MATNATAAPPSQTADFVDRCDMPQKLEIKTADCADSTDIQIVDNRGAARLSRKSRRLLGSRVRPCQAAVGKLGVHTMKVLIVAVSAAVGFAIAFYWPGRASEEVRNDRGTVAGAASSKLALIPEDAVLLDFAGSIESVDPASLGSLYASLRERFGAGRIEVARRLVLLRWAETAPVEALAWLKANAPRDLEMFLVAWSASDPAAAWRAARGFCLCCRTASTGSHPRPSSLC
jgi:hypothetical protein